MDKITFGKYKRKDSEKIIHFIGVDKNKKTTKECNLDNAIFTIPIEGKRCT